LNEKSVHFLQRAARIASAVLAIQIPSVCPSITRRYCVKTTARSTVQFAYSQHNTQQAVWLFVFLVWRHYL